MADNSQQTSGDLDLTSHLQFAVREIEASVHLRVLVKHFLGACSVVPPAAVFDLNPVQNAYNQGFQACGMMFAEILTSVEPRIVPTLMLEELTENVSQSQE